MEYDRMNLRDKFNFDPDTKGLNNLKTTIYI